jgi:hypothetical protein
LREETFEFIDKFLKSELSSKGDYFLISTFLGEGLESNLGNLGNDAGLTSPTINNIP